MPIYNTPQGPLARPPSTVRYVGIANCSLSRPLASHTNAPAAVTTSVITTASLVKPGMPPSYLHCRAVQHNFFRLK